MSPAFAEQWSDLLGVLHSVLLFTMLLLVVVCSCMTFMAAKLNWKRIQVVGLLAVLSYLATGALGLLTYPTAAERALRIGIYQTKEDIAALGFFVAIALGMLIVFGHLRRTSTRRRQLFAGLFASLALIAVIVSGLSLVISYS
jgi:hypothetical protein